MSQNVTAIPLGVSENVGAGTWPPLVLEIHSYARHSMQLWLQMLVFCLTVQSLAMGWFVTSTTGGVLLNRIRFLPITYLFMMLLASILYMGWLKHAKAKIEELGFPEIGLSLFHNSLLVSQGAIMGFGLIWLLI